MTSHILEPGNRVEGELRRGFATRLTRVGASGPARKTVHAGSLEGAVIRDAFATTKNVTGTVTFNESRDPVKPSMMIKIEPGGRFVIAERMQIDGAAAPKLP
jgi:hypothetical protein